MSNLMPGDNSGMEPPEHYRQCATNCEHADHVFDEDKGLRGLMMAAASLSWWKEGDRPERVVHVQHMCKEAWVWLECPVGHRSHECNCEELAEMAHEL